MAIKFNQFTTGDVSNTGSADYLVGYDSTQDGVAGGERKWTLATIANAVSGVMTPQLNSAFFNSTDVIPIANGGTGQTTAFAGLVALANGGASIASKYLKVNAGNTALEYDTIDLSTADVTGVLPVANGGTGGSTGGPTTAKAWVNFDGIASGTWDGGSSTVTRVNGSTTATITTTNAHGLTTGNRVYVLTGVVAGTYAVTVLTSNTFTITTVATTALNAASITFQVSPIRSQYNVSSVTKNGLGTYTVNFATPMADANYVVTGNTSNNNASISWIVTIGIMNTASVGVFIENGSGTPQNGDPVCVAVIGN